MAPTSTLLFSGFAVLAVSSPILPRAGEMGLHFAEPSGCTPDQVTGVMNAIADTRTLAQGAISALKTSKQNPAAYFFPSSYAQLATGVFGAVLAATQSSEQLDSMDADSNLNPIQLTCQDVSSMCSTPAPDNNGGSTSPRLGYIPQGSNPAPGFGTAQIVICPAMFELPRTPAPCTGTPGLANLGWGFLRTFVMLRSVQSGFDRLARDAIGDGHPGAEGAHSLLDGGYQANTDNYAQLATWSNDLGVKDTSVQCPNVWPADWS